MNSSSIVKRTLPLIVVLVLIIGIAISCTLISTERDIPTISNKDGVYATYNYGEGQSYTVTNDLMYQTLRTKGLSLVMEWVDTKILSAEKNADGKSYYELASSDGEGLIALKSETIYGDEEKKAELTDEEKTDAEESYVENMKASGFKNVTAACASLADLTNEEKDYFAVQLARKLYAWDQLAKDIEEQDKKADETKDDEEPEDPYFTNKEIEDYYDSNYKDGYWAIVVPFASKVAVERALAQLGIEMSDSSNSSKGWKWINPADESKPYLTASEILDAHIKLYNNVNAYKGDGKTELVDTSRFNFSGMSSSVTEGDKTKYSFDASKCEAIKDYFYYTHDELNKLNSSVRSRLAGSTLKPFFENNSGPDATSTDVGGYQKSAYSSSNTYYLILKLAIEDTKELWTDEENEVMDSSLKAEIIGKLTEEEKTDSLVKTKMAELRKNYELMFYDSTLESQYIGSYDSEFEETKKEDTSSICRIVVGEETLKLSTDDYFASLSKRQGMAYLGDIINKEVVLNSEFNEVVNYTTGMSYKQLKKNVKDQDKWNELLESIQTLKTNFAGNAFSYYGYDSSYGWLNFLRDFYMNYYGTLITSEEDLMVYNIYQDTLQNWAKTLNDYSNNTDLQDFVDQSMKDTYDEYFNATGYHLLISVYEEDGETLVNPLEDDSWSEAQVAAAKELYEAVIDMINKTESNPTKVLEDFVTAYNAAPYYSLYNVNGTKLPAEDLLDPSKQPTLSENPYQYTGLAGYVSGLSINISKYKTLGLSVKYESLSSFGPGKMVEEFETVAKYVWQTMYEDGQIHYNDEDDVWEVDDANFVATKDIVKEATKTDTTEGTEYLVTEFGYHVYVQTSAEGFSGETPSRDNAATEEVKKEFKEYRVPTAEEIKKYLEIVNSDEYKDIVESDGYESGDEDELFEIHNDDGELTGYKLTPWQRGCISKFYTSIGEELEGSYAMSLVLSKDLMSGLNNLTLSESAGFSKDDYKFVLEIQVKYAVEQLKYVGDYYKKLFPTVDFE